MVNWIDRQIDALGKAPYPKVVCITGNNGTLREIIFDIIVLSFRKNKVNHVDVNVSNFSRSIVFGNNMSNWGRERTGILTTEIFNGKEFSKICKNEKKIEEYERTVWDGAEGYIETAISEGGHDVITISSAILPVISSTTIQEGSYWNNKAYRILVNSKESIDTGIDYSNVEADIVIDSIDTFKNKLPEILNAINEKESYRPGSRYI